MQATTKDKLAYYVAILLLSLCVLALVWVISGAQFATDGQPRVLAQPQTYQPPAKEVVSGKPLRVVIPSVSIDLAVSDGNYNEASGTWTIASRQAFYATPTPLVNDDRGTTMIYGHNNRTAFRNLRDLQPGAGLTVYTDTGYAFHYVYESAVEVEPTDVTPLRRDGPPTVILQTCSGNWNEYRKLFQFTLESINKVGQVSG